jgi:hypothetical protein
MDFIVARFAAVPEHLHVQPVVSSGEVLLGCLEVEAEELWSFVQKKVNPHWVWIAMDKQTRQGIALHGGTAARTLPNSYGPRSQQCTASREPSIRSLCCLPGRDSGRPSGTAAQSARTCRRGPRSTPSAELVPLRH